jgi:ferredoxin
MLTNLLFDRILSKTDTAKVVFSERRCLRTRLNSSECRSCLDECQTSALKLDGRTIAFKQDQCTGCMRCVSACPNDAFDGNLDLEHLLETLSCASQVVLTCRKNAHFQQKFLIPCIGSLSESLLAAMNSIAAGSFFVDLSHCSDCVNKHCLISFNRKVGKLTDRLKVSRHIPLKYNFEKNSVHPVGENVTRRSYLALAKKSLIELGRKPIGTKQRDTSSSHNNGEKRPAMNSVALYYAYRNSSDENKHILRSFFYTVSVTDQCNVCPRCQGMCPTGALKRTKVKGKKQLMFTSSACNGCRLCQEFCRRNVIKIDRGFSGDPEEPLYIY